MCLCISITNHAGINSCGTCKSFICNLHPYMNTHHYLVAKLYHIKTHDRVSEAKKAVWCTSVLFTGTANSPFSTPCIYISTGPICIKFTYFILAYTWFYIPGNWPSSLWDMCILKIAPFSSHFSSLHHFFTNNFEATKDTLLVDQFLFNLAHLRIRHFVAYFSLNFGDV